MTTIGAAERIGDAAKERRAERIVSLDALRGLAIAGMIFVNSPGSWEYVYPPLGHAPWHGWTLADMVFPTFLFAVGAALALAFPHAADAPSKRRFWIRVARRTALLILLGVFLNALPQLDLAHLRLPGVLQRIGLCYAAAAALCMLTALPGDNQRLQLNVAFVASAALVLLVGYWALMTFTPVPGVGAGRLDSFGNVAAYVDRAVFGVDHLWRYATTEGMGVTYDPEGLLSTLPAIANVLIGVLAGWLLKQSGGLRNGVILAVAGGVLLALGLALHPLFPINKNIWTSTFVLFSSGFAIVVLGLLMLAFSWAPALSAAWPLRVLGGNAILAYMISSIMGAYAQTPFIPSADGTLLGAQPWAFGMMSAFIGDPYLASFACAALVLALITLLLVPLDRYGVHLRI